MPDTTDQNRLTDSLPERPGSIGRRERRGRDKGDRECKRRVQLDLFDDMDEEIGLEVGAGTPLASEP